jgi:hypothetical protein
LRKQREKKATQERELAIQANNRAQIEAAKLKAQSERLAIEIKDVNDQIDKVQFEKEHQLAEEVFIRDYAAKAEANAAGLNDFIAKINAVDKAIADAEKPKS